jgi:hypothetical protein
LISKLSFHAIDWTALRSIVIDRRKPDHSPQWHRCGGEQDQAVPGHDVAIPVDVKARGGARGWLQRPKVSTMRIRPPQQGQG